MTFLQKRPFFFTTTQKHYFSGFFFEIFLFHFSYFPVYFFQHKKEKNKKCTFFFENPFLTPWQTAKKYFRTPTHYLWFLTYPKNTIKLGKTSQKKSWTKFWRNLGPSSVSKNPNLGPSSQVPLPPKNWHFWRKSAAKWPRNEIFHENRPQNIFDAARWLPEACPKVPPSLPEGSGKVHPVPRRSPKVPRRFVQNLGKLLNIFEIWHLWGTTWWRIWRWPKRRWGRDSFYYRRGSEHIQGSKLKRWCGRGLTFKKRARSTKFGKCVCERCIGHV